MQYVVNTLCSLNPSAAEHHKLVLERHGLPFNVKYRLKRDADLNFYLPYLRRMSFEETMDFISLLFELAIVDGIIRKEDWNYIYHLQHDMSISNPNEYADFNTTESMLYFINGLCALNPSAAEYRQPILERLRLNFKFDSEDGLADRSLYVETLNQLAHIAKVDFIHVLFELAITDDGIKMDEWIYIYQLMCDLKIPSNYMTYFKSMYKPLCGEDKQNTSQYDIKVPSPNSELLKYYSVLGVSADATYGQVRSAYRKLALTYHPDLPKNKDNKEECQEKMMLINDAFHRITCNFGIKES